MDLNDFSFSFIHQVIYRTVTGGSDDLLATASMFVDRHKTSASVSLSVTSSANPSPRQQVNNPSMHLTTAMHNTPQPSMQSYHSQARYDKRTANSSAHPILRSNNRICATSEGLRVMAARDLSDDT
jgi:hypothetical protein